MHEELYSKLTLDEEFCGECKNVCRGVNPCDSALFITGVEYSEYESLASEAEENPRLYLIDQVDPLLRKFHNLKGQESLRRSKELKGAIDRETLNRTKEASNQDE
jgi:hypothetical protein